MKLFLVVVVLTVAAFTANCRDIPGGQPVQKGDDTYISNGLQEVKERSKPELRGKNNKNIMKQVLAKLKDLMNTNKNLTVDMNIIKEHQLNETDSNTEVKMELESLMETVNASNSEIQNLSKENALAMSMLESISALQVHGFEIYYGRLIRRTTTADTKGDYNASMRFCDQFNGKPFIPRTEGDYELVNIVRKTLGNSGYQWLPADDMQEEGVLRLYNGEVDTNVGLWKWYNDEELSHNTASRDCLNYGGSGDPTVYMKICGNSLYPPICEIL